jgi:hypothetical protein
MSPWLKAGLIGGAILVVLALGLAFLGQVLGVGCLIMIVMLLAYAGIGALAAYGMPSPREAGPSAGQGALAASLAQLIGGAVYTLISVVQTMMVDVDEVLSQLPPELLAQAEQQGMDPQMFEVIAGPLGGLLGGGMCCIGGLILAAILGAIGGAAFAAMQPE